MYQQDDYERISARLRVDRIAIDDALIEHPIFLLEANEFCARAEEIRDQKKAALSVNVALAADALRAPPSAGEKVRSETRIESEIPLDENVIEARETLIEAELSLNLWRALAEAMRERGHNLRKYADLTIAGYTAPNSAIDERRKEINEVREIKRRGHTVT